MPENETILLGVVMFFDRVEQIPELAQKQGTSVFVVPREAKVEIPGAILLQPEDRATITIEQVRRMEENVQKRQVGEFYVILRPAERIGEPASNALLKTLEQPGERVHFVLVAEQPAALLPTILSRAAVYYLRTSQSLSAPVVGDEKLKKLARQLLVAKGAELVDTARNIAKAKTGETQKQALEVLALAVEMCYKSYFKTGKTAFLHKIPPLIKAHESIARGGNIKLQIVANLG